MDDLFDKLKNQWKEAKLDQPENKAGTNELIREANKQLKSVVHMHVGNIAILLFTLIGISAFFYFVARFQNTLSHIGVSLMIGGLTLRILIEGYSIYKSGKIDLSSATNEANNQFIRFYRYRRQIHGPVTILILLGYTVGYYLLIPEFSLYFSRFWIIVLAGSYPLAAAIFGFSIRKAIKDEMKYLNEVKRLGQVMDK